LIERDSLMKFWFYRYSPDLYDIWLLWENSTKSLSIISKNFNVKLFKINSLVWYTTLAFWTNIDKKDNKPKFIYGSSHSFNEKESINWAIKELFMTYNNIKHYDFKSIEKTEVKSVMDHYYYYQDWNNFKQLDFLFKYNKYINYIENQPLYDFEWIIWKIPFSFYILNLTPEFLFKKWIYIVKVISWELQPMDFWYHNLKINKNIDLKNISKNSLLFPHPFF